MNAVHVFTPLFSPVLTRPGTREVRRSAMRHTSFLQTMAMSSSPSHSIGTPWTTGTCIAAEAAAATDLPPHMQAAQRVECERLSRLYRCPEWPRRRRRRRRRRQRMCRSTWRRHEGAWDQGWRRCRRQSQLLERPPRTALRPHCDPGVAKNCVRAAPLAPLPLPLELRSVSGMRKSHQSVAHAARLAVAARRLLASGRCLVACARWGG